MSKICFGWLCVCVLCLYSCKQQKVFETISSSHSGIEFDNTITENDSINPLDVVNIYNGGGVGVGDFNNDGLQDIYFTGNMVPSKLYINKGDFKFDDVTEIADVAGMGRWARGVSVIDINNDGLMDLYVCNTIYKDSLRRQNILYVNQGIDKNGVPHFKDMAVEYGLDIHVQSTMAYFFDYDNDGDLDMYLTVNEASNGNNSSVFSQHNSNSANSVGRLYRNDVNSTLKHGVYRDVSKEAGIVFDGYGHSTSITDINLDGWKDIYVADDFLSNNILYINNHDGTFTNRSKEYFKHTSLNAMGQDIADINNDGLADVIELDMSPEDNYRKKMMLGPNSYNVYQNFDRFGYQYQYVRNTLQLNLGPRVGQNDTIGPPAFSEISFMSKIAETDWSWTPLVADFDNDSYRDLIVTNGFPRDVSDHDFIAYRKDAIVTHTQSLLQQIPQVKLHNYAFHNNGDLTFNDATNDWGLSVPTFSNGAAYADFDNDGAVDMVINNINDKALLYRNSSRDKDTAASYFQILFEGDRQNINGLGAIANIYYNHDKQQVYENNPYRGYLSSVQDVAHFGLGKTTLIDSVVIKWNNGKQQTLKNIKANQTLKVNIADAKDTCLFQHPVVATNALFKEVTKASGISYTHSESDLIDFDIQSLLPHKFSEYCPAVAAGDLNGDGFDDMIVGGNMAAPAQVMLQQANGKFITRNLSTNPNASTYTNNYRDEGILLFDANGDNKPDLYIASGGYMQMQGSNTYQDRLYINDGKGNFKADTSALPNTYTSKLCVRAMDYNHDGKLDLFVSGRVDPRNYPKPVSSYIFRNDSREGHVKFTDVTNEVAPDLKNIGMVCDALFTDFDGDGQADLLLAGEWMPVTFLKNINGKFKNVTATTGISSKTGWWNSIAAGDFRHTGRTDYIIGNAGLNTLFHASDKYPVYVTAKDFFNNGSYVPVPSYFIPDQRGELKEYPAFGRDDVIERMPALKKKFDHYKQFAVATMNDVFTREQLQGALRLKATMLQSSYLRNDGGGKFTMIPLPKEAQVSTIDGMVTDDFDGDGNLDVLLSGNDYGIVTTIGRYDAMNGLLLKGDGKGNFVPQSILQSGVYIPGNAKALVKLMSSSGKYMIASSENKGALKLFELKRKISSIKVNPDEVKALIRYKNGKIQKEEFYYGSSFLSQSTRYCNVSSDVADVAITNNKGNTRTVVVNK